MPDVLSFNLKDLQELIFFLLPGFLTIIFFFYQIPARKKSELEVITFSFLFSVLLNYLTNLTFGLVNLITNLKLNLTNKGVEYNITSIFLGIILAIILARFFRSKVFSFINRKIFNVRSFPFERIWNSFLNLPLGSHLKIFLTNGVVYVGMLRRFSIDPNDEIQEIVLWKPIYYDPKKKKLTPVKETESVLINRTAIVSIEKISDEEAKKIYKGN